MNYKEFVPTTQLRESYSYNKDGSKFQPGNLASTSYMEPAFYQPSIGTEETKNKVEHNQGYDEATVRGQSGLRIKEENYLDYDDVTVGHQSGMNLAAASWLPPTALHQTTSNGSQEEQASKLGGEQKICFFNEEPQQVDGSYIEPVVEIFWNGNSYFVPESTAYMYDEQMGYPQSLEEEAGIEWAGSSAPLINLPKRNLMTIGVPESVRQHFQVLDTEALKQSTPSECENKDIPSRYNSVFILDDAAAKATVGSYGCQSTLFKVVDRTDNQIYALRRVEIVRNNAASIKSSLAKWFEIRHPGIVSLYSINQERGALYFTHAYHPAAVTLKQRFIDQRGPLLGEPLIWRLFTQLLSALRVVHSKGMALRSITPQHVLLTSGAVARYNNAGIADLVDTDVCTLNALHTLDLVMLGYLILSLASRASVDKRNSDQAALILEEHYSSELHLAVLNLLSGKVTAVQVCHLISDKMHDEFDMAMAASDSLHAHLRNEFENGRMLRLLMKMGFINERPEYMRAPQWSETGDRYVLKLFRDFVFHQALSDGAAVVDAGHVVTSLNKLDCSDSEQMLLSSRDNKDLLVVSFADVRRCLESSYLDLDQQADQAQQTTSTPGSTQNQQSLGLSQGLGPGSGMEGLGGESHYAGTNPGLSRRAAARLAAISNADPGSMSSVRPRSLIGPSGERGRGGGGNNGTGNGNSNGSLSYPASSGNNGNRPSVNPINSFMSSSVTSGTVRSTSHQYQSDGPGLFASYTLQQQRNLQIQQQQHQLQQLQLKQHNQKIQQQQHQQQQHQQQQQNQRQQHQLLLLQQQLLQQQQQQQIKLQIKMQGSTQNSGTLHSRYAAQQPSNYSSAPTSSSLSLLHQHQLRQSMGSGQQHSPTYQRQQQQYH